MTKEDTERAKEQARAQLDSIIEMVKRYKHCQECNGDDCELTDEEILNGLEILYKEGMTASEEDKESYHNEDDARQRIEEAPLSVQVRSDWHNPGEDSSATEYEILLCTGGPAVRIVGDLDEHNQPENVKLEYQDWFTPWIRYGNTSSDEDSLLLEYANCFYFSD